VAKFQFKLIVNRDITEMYCSSPYWRWYEFMSLHNEVDGN